MNFPFSLAALTLAEFAPKIGQWLGGGDRAESIASRVTETAKKITGANDMDSIVHSFRENPQHVYAFQKELYAMETEVELALIYDRQEARKRDTQILSSTGKRNKRGDVMVICAVIGLGICLGALCFFSNDAPLPGEAIAVISTIAGIFGSCLKDAYSFEFGSSKGSRQKDENLAAIIDQL